MPTTSGDKPQTLALHAAALVVAFGAAYLPHVGHGFIKDDFAWINHGTLEGLESLPLILFGSVGFYRPVVSLSFGLNEAAFGRWSLGYGLTNFVLVVACAALLFVLARTLRLPAWGALLASSVWAFNFHGINMAVLWLSGRTALLLTCFSLLAALAALQGRLIATFGFSLLALGSKEEAVVLPLILGVLAGGGMTDDSGRGRFVRVARASGPALAALAVYAVLRARSTAFTPDTAPSFYRLALDPWTALGNVAQYADRSATLAAAVLLLLLAYWRRVPETGSARSAIVAAGAVWWVAGFAITVWLPVRSSLYAVWPSIGVALIAAALADGMRQDVAAPRLRRAALAAVVLPFLLLPVFWSRNVRWVELADLSAATFDAIDEHLGSLAPGTIIELRDDPSTRANFQNALGTLYPEAARLYYEDRHQLWIEPPPPELAASGVARPPAPTAAVFALRDRQVVRLE